MRDWSCAQFAAQYERDTTRRRASTQRYVEIGDVTSSECGCAGMREPRVAGMAHLRHRHLSELFHTQILRCILRSDAPTSCVHGMSLALRDFPHLRLLRHEAVEKGDERVVGQGVAAVNNFLSREQRLRESLHLRAQNAMLPRSAGIACHAPL